MTLLVARTVIVGCLGETIGAGVEATKLDKCLT